MTSEQRQTFADYREHLDRARELGDRFQVGLALGKLQGFGAALLGGEDEAQGMRDFVRVQKAIEARIMEEA